MKKLLLILTIVLISLAVLAQISPTSTVRIQSATQSFGQNISVGTEVYNIATGQLWKCIIGTASDQTLTSVPDNFKPIIRAVKGTLPMVVDSTTRSGWPIVSINAATQSTAGSLSAADKIKIDNTRLLTNHDSLTNLDEKSYDSLDDLPDLTIYTVINDSSKLYKLKSDSTATTGYTSRERLASQISTREPVLTKGTFTETIDGLVLSDSTRTVIGGATILGLKTGRVIPTATNISHAETAYSNRVTSISAGTGLTGGTITATGSVAIDTTVVAKKTTVAAMYEPKFAKNTGFNKNFGSTTGTVLEGRTFGTAANSAIGDFAPESVYPASGLTTGYVPYKTSTVLGNSGLFYDGTNLGIGTTALTNPQSWGRLLQVYNTGTNGSALSLNDASVNGEWNIASYGTELRFANGGNLPAILVKQNGSVGIGTVGSSELFHISKLGSADDVTAFIENTACDAGSNSRLLLSTKGTDGNPCQVSIVNRQTGTQAGDLIFQTLGNDRVTIQSTGNVGIDYITGTEIGNNKLAVNGSAYFAGNITAPSATFTTGAGLNKIWTSDASGNGTWSPSITATSLSVTGATSGTATIVTPSVAKTPTLTLPTRTGTFAVVVDSIRNSVVSSSPTENVVYDNLALKAPIADPTFTGVLVTPAIRMTTTPAAGYFLQSDASGNGTWASVAASQVYKGTWDASTNTPTLADGTGTAGWYYRVTVAGTVDLDGGGARAAVTFYIGDDVSYNGTIWQQIPSALINGLALTPADDTNIDLSVSAGGSTALLSATTITATWQGILASARGGTGNGFTKFTGPATAEKTFTLPNASATILTTNDLVSVAQGGTGASTAGAARTNLGVVIGTDVQAYNANLTGINQALTTTSSPSFTTVNANLAGNATTVTNGVYTTGAGTVYEVPLTFSTGLTRTGNTVTNTITQFTTANEIDPKFTLDSAYIKSHIRTDLDKSVTNEIQDLSIAGNVISLSGDATTITLPIAAVQVNSDWSSVSGVSQILNKPTIPTQYTDAAARASISENVQGLSYTPATGVFDLTGGFVIPTSTQETNWNKYMQWDGSSTGLVAATGRTSLGGTTIGQSMFTLTNPSAITFPRFNVDNTVTALNAADFRTAIGAGSSSTMGTVTSVATGLGLSGGTITTTGTLLVDTTTIVSKTFSGNHYKLVNDSTASTGYTSRERLASQISTRVEKNTNITSATKTKITYDVKGLVTAGADATTADIAASTNKNYVTDAQQTVIGNTSGTNTGDRVFFTEMHTETGTSTPGYTWTLGHTAINYSAGGMHVELNGFPLTSSQFTATSTTVRVNIPVYEFDVVAITYQY